MSYQKPEEPKLYTLKKRKEGDIHWEKHTNQEPFRLDDGFDNDGTNITDEEIESFLQ